MAMAASLASLPCHDLSMSVHVTNTLEEEEDGGYQSTCKRYEEIKPILAKERGWMSEHLVKYQGFWFSPNSGLKAVIFSQHHFKAHPTDIILASSPKTGTTWLKALIFATINRSNYGFSTHPLLTTGPHGCVPILDLSIHQETFISHLRDHSPPPRFFSTHIPCPLLPESMITSGCKIVYICRDPKDVLVSKWVFMNKLRPKNLKPLSLEEAFELFCGGVSHYGPYWDHVLGYWQMSLALPDKVLFLKYEDVRREPLVCLRSLAEFVGQPFTQEEEDGGVVEKIVKLCSFESLSNLPVNKTTVQRFNDELNVENRHFFRKGQVGDSKNHLTPKMAETLDRITYDKFHAFGLKLGQSSDMSRHSNLA